LNRFPPLGEGVATDFPESIAFVEKGQNGLPFTEFQQIVDEGARAKGSALVSLDCLA
jgi:hypothetical protein